MLGMWSLTSRSLQLGEENMNMMDSDIRQNVLCFKRDTMIRKIVTDTVIHSDLEPN